MILKNQPKGFYMAFEAKREEINYLDKDFDKVVMNFVGIETACAKCKTFFSLKSKLYKHLKAGCIKTVQTSLPLTPPTLLILIVESKSIPQSLGTGLVFRD